MVNIFPDFSLWAEGGRQLLSSCICFSRAIHDRSLLSLSSWHMHRFPANATEKTKTRTWEERVENCYKWLLEHSEWWISDGTCWESTSELAAGEELNCWGPPTWAEWRLWVFMDSAIVKDQTIDWSTQPSDLKSLLHSVYQFHTSSGGESIFPLFGFWVFFILETHKTQS